MFAGCSMFYLEEYYRIKGHTSQKIAKYNTQNSEWTLDMFSVYLCKVSYFATFYSIWQCYTCQVKIMLTVKWSKAI